MSTLFVTFSKLGSVAVSEILEWHNNSLYSLTETRNCLANSGCTGLNHV